MSLQALVLCSDDKTTRVLRRILSDLEIAVEFCSDADAAVRKLTRRRFEAVVVDCNDEDMAAQALKSVRAAPCNKRSIAVAMIDGQTAVRSAFALGAHFVLYKPISAERARTSFRAARALMKCERRRNTRVPMQIPVALVGEKGSGQRKAVTSDISQGGMSIKLSRRAQKSGPMRIKFTLPGTDHDIECAAEVAWEGDGSQAGIRFSNLSSEQRDHLKVWLARHAPEMELDDPPSPCQLTDLSSGGCYLEMAAPFPMNTRVILIMRLKKLESRVEGVVRVMHPEAGMGVEFTRTTNQQRKHLEEFIHALKSHKGAQPEMVVEPEGMNDAEPVSSTASVMDDLEDPLLELFQRNADLTAESFLSELRKQRSSPPLAAQVASGSL
ncbi:MAG TPA: PilZ domain-containing protein [Terriglobales bacterium]|nr:PilZ domain-containing protein [Terriglobales bacterium]